MAISPLDSTLWGGLYGDAELGALFADTAELAAMVEVERALARAQGRCGVIPAEAALAIDVGLETITLDPAELTSGTTAAGVPVPALVKALRAALPTEAGHWLHWGATSQDIVDSGAVLRLARALTVLETRLGHLIDRLTEQARAHAGTPMAGRTRSQIATPIPFGLRIANWAAPLIALEARLPAVRAEVCRVLLGGASGSNTVLGETAPAVATAFAEELSLAPAPPWGTARTGMAELGAWAAQLSAALGKAGADLILLGRSEAGEASAGTGGSSSTMPQKQNPVAAEALVTLGRLAGPLSGTLNGALAHAEERDAAAWALEWFALPPLIVGAGAGLRHATALADSLSADAERMRALLETGGCAALAEAASFGLAEHMPRADAQALVKQAVKATAAGETLRQALARLSGREIDWDACLDAAMASGRDTIEAILATRRPPG
ncbi:MAG: lyase family protein [Pseudomonadota bacterium]